MNNLYIASCMEDGGIYQYHMSKEGRMELIEKFPMDRPMYMTVSDGKMYVILRAPFGDNNESGVVVYDIDDKGRLINPSEIMSTKGEVACHIAVDKGEIFCANYISGSVIKLTDTLIEHKGKGIHPSRQDSAHTHFVGFTPDNKYLCAVDLGVDTIFVYNKDLTLYSKANVPSGHGARHIVFSEDGQYMFCANELESTLSVFSYNDGKLELLHTIALLPSDFKEKNTAAAIRLYNGKIYVSHRGHNSVAKVGIDKGKPVLEGFVDCKGISPRDFDFINGKMICTNEASDNITVFDAENDFEYLGSYEVGAPLCVVGK